MLNFVVMGDSLANKVQKLHNANILVTLKDNCLKKYFEKYDFRGCDPKNYLLKHFSPIFKEIHPKSITCISQLTLINDHMCALHAMTIFYLLVFYLFFLNIFA